MLPIVSSPLSVEAVKAPLRGKTRIADSRGSRRSLNQSGAAMGKPMQTDARLMQALTGIIDPRVSEVEGGKRAAVLARWYAGANAEARRQLWLLMSEHFRPDAEQMRSAQQALAAVAGTAEEAAAQVEFRRATVSPRRRILQRFSATEGGIRFLVDLRAEMQPALKVDSRLRALDVEMEYMFSTWFDVGFLDLARISWDSPASLLEKLIRYEAVHDIRSWADLKNRLDSDRRCYGFFHPRLPGEPLIFVEVAFTDELAASITPLLDEFGAEADTLHARTAIFYSISNTQLGLRGVSFGDSLIKRVVQALKDEFPQLKTFATLSPIPGLRAWLTRTDPALAAELQAMEPAALMALPEGEPLRVQLQAQAARYLARELVNQLPADPVARFHLGNGACVERLNWAADPSAKGVKQSFGLMVNYLYDLRRLDRHRAMLNKGKIPASASVGLLLPA
jgi:malonyl-CoA decarboxylase